MQLTVHLVGGVVGDTLSPAGGLGANPQGLVLFQSPVTVEKI